MACREDGPDVHVRDEQVEELLEIADGVAADYAEPLRRLGDV